MQLHRLSFHFIFDIVQCDHIITVTIYITQLTQEIYTD